MNFTYKNNLTNDQGNSIRRLIIFRDAYDYYHDRYQVYFRQGLSMLTTDNGGEIISKNMFGPEKIAEYARLFKYSYKIEQNLGFISKKIKRSVDFTMEFLYKRRKTPSGVFNSLVGQYIIEFSDGKIVKICIDARDAALFVDEELLNWSDIYFKTNFSSSIKYNDKVRPLYVASQHVFPNIERLKNLRNFESIYDLAFIVRVWGGENETDGIEHNIRLLESVVKVKCNKIVVAYLVAGNIEQLTRRLEKIGVLCITNPYSLTKLWEVSSLSKLNIIRLGMHYCIPWRMHDLLAMGACPVLDQSPLTHWLEPLTENKNYFQLDCPVKKGFDIASEEGYQNIPLKIEKLLSNQEAIDLVKNENSKYFDRHLSPEKIASQIITEARINRFS